jgi:hypothetical protein
VAEVVDNRDPDAIAKGRFRRLLRRQLLEEPTAPETVKIAGQKLFFPDAYYLESSSNIDFHTIQAETHQISKTRTVPELHLQHGFGIAIVDGKLVSPYQTLDNYFRESSERRFMATASFDDLDNWEIKEISQNINDYDDIAIGQDFGFNHANAILLLGIKDDNIYILDEIYLHEKDTSEIIQEAIMHAIPTKKQMWCDSAEPDRIKEWTKAGYRARGVDKGGSAGSVKAQIDWLKQRYIYVHPHCINTIKELQQWKWKKDERSGEYFDEPVPVMDDAMAALRYGVEGWRKVKKWMI